MQIEEPLSRWPDEGVSPVWILSRTGSTFRPNDWVLDASGNRRYRIVRFRSQLGAQFLDPVSDHVSFLYKPAGFMTTRKVVVEPDVEHVFGRFRFRMRGSAYAWEFSDEGGAIFAELVLRSDNMQAVISEAADSVLGGDDEPDPADKLWKKLLSKEGRAALMDKSHQVRYVSELRGDRGLYGRFTYAPMLKAVAAEAGDCSLDRRLLALAGYLVLVCKGTVSTGD